MSAMSEPRSRRPRRRFTDDFKQQAVRLVIDEGKSVTAVVRVRMKRYMRWTAREITGLPSDQEVLVTEVSETGRVLREIALESVGAMVFRAPSPLCAATSVRPADRRGTGSRLCRLGRGVRGVVVRSERFTPDLTMSLRAWGGNALRPVNDRTHG